ncbi:MAG: TetR/AcrR family transcriptional regulator [Myxococcota bacterium]
MATRPGRTTSGAEPVEEASTRELIVRTALRRFSEQGFDGASTRSIAQTAGVNQGLIPYYFKTKQALWREAVDLAFSELHEALGSFEAVVDAKPSREELARLLRRYVQFVAAHPEFVLLMNEEGKRSGPRMRWITDRHVKPLFDSLTRLFEGIRGEAGFAPGVPGIHFNYIFAGAVGLIFSQAPECQRVADYDPTTPDAIAAHADALVALFFGEASLGRAD